VVGEVGEDSPRGRMSSEWNAGPPQNTPPPPMVDYTAPPPEAPVSNGVPVQIGEVPPAYVPPAYVDLPPAYVPQGPPPVTAFQRANINVSDQSPEPISHNHHQHKDSSLGAVGVHAQGAGDWKTSRVLQWARENKVDVGIAQMLRLEEVNGDDLLCAFGTVEDVEDLLLANSSTKVSKVKMASFLRKIEALKKAQ
jgi:hypothetical protein